MKEELNGLVVSHKPISEHSLKRLLLIFDKVYIIRPEENRFLIPKDIAKVEIKVKNQNMQFNMPDYGILYNGREFQNRENDTLDKFDYAIQKGVVRILDLSVRKFYHKNWLPLRVAHEYDSANANLLNHYIPLVENIENVLTEDGLLRGGGMSFSGIQILPETPPQIKFFSEDENKKFNSDHQILSASGKINRALAASTEFDLIPIFLNENIANAYTTKVNVASQNSEVELQNAFFKKHNVQLDKVQYLLHRISEVLLPDHLINEISVKELVIARNNSYEQCIKLRRKLIRSLHFVATENHGADFTNEVSKYIKNEIEPMIDSYHKVFMGNLSNFLNHAMPTLPAMAAAVIGFNQNLTMMETVFWAGVSTYAGSVTSKLTEHISSSSQKNFRNGFSYFLNLRE